MTQAALRFVRGHGTQNDFILLPDPNGVLELPAALVRALCDRRSGLGGDGVLRAVRADGAHGVPRGPGVGVEDAAWFMDYRNADGSLAEMCGNGARVFARYLVAAGLAEPGTLRIATRGGVKTVRVPAAGGDIAVDMGPPTFTGESVARLGSHTFAGVRVSMGNPHLVCPTAAPVAAVDLSGAPEVDATAFPDGVNVEVINLVAGGAVGGAAGGAAGGGGRTRPPAGADLLVRMRVWERGVGETRSCGTGACAAAAVALRTAGLDAGTVAVDLPGGTVMVAVSGGTTVLTGPAVLVASGTLDPAWVAAACDGEVPPTVLADSRPVAADAPAELPA